MQKIFQEYGGVIATAMAIVALIGLLGMLFTPGGTGWMDNAFRNVIDGFEDKTDNAIKVTNGKTLEGNGQTFYTLAPSTLTFGSKAPKSEFQEIKINGETLDDFHYTVTNAAPGTQVTLSLDYLKTLDAATYQIEVVSESMIPRGTFSVVEPELNEHGFYYNQPYTGNVSALGSEYALFFRENDTMDLIRLETNYTETCPYTVSGNVITASTSMGTIQGNVAADGTTMYCPQLATNVALGDESIAADEDYIYVYKESLGGYEVTCIDKTKASYGAIRTGINGKPTVALVSCMFSGNSSLVVAPTIPDGVTNISGWTFADCTSLCSITIPDGVTSVGESVFRGCTGLTSVTFGENSQLTSIGRSAFSGCTSLTSITIPEGVTSICDYTFYDCTDLISVTILDGVTSIEQFAFQNCMNLTEITIPEYVTSIGHGAFLDCKNLANITFEGTMSKWKAISKNSSWNWNCNEIMVDCTDGTVNVPAW